MSASLAALLVALAIVATGRGVLSACRLVPPDRFTASGVAVAAGLGVTLLVGYAPLAVTGRVDFVPLVGLHAAALVAAGAHVLRRRRRSAPAHGAAVAVAVACLLYVDLVSSNPLDNYDAKAIYGLKAKVLLHEGTLHSPAFQDVDVVHYHADYPLGLPLLMAYVGALAGGSPVRGADAWAPDDAGAWSRRWSGIEAAAGLDALWALGFAALVAGAVARAGRQRARWWLLAVVPVALVAPWDQGASWRGTPELPLALCLAATAVCIADGPGAGRVRWRRAPARDTCAGSSAAGVQAGAADVRAGAAGRMWLVAAPCAAGATMLKQDALLGLGCLLVAVLAVRRGRGGAAAAARVVAGATLGLLPVLAVRASIPTPPFDEQYLGALARVDVGTVLARAVLLPRAALEALVSADALLFWLFTAAVAVPLGWRGGERRSVLACAVVLHLLCCLAIFLVTPNHVHWHVRTALVRLWSQMAGPACLLVVAACAELWAHAPQGGRRARRMCAPGASGTPAVRAARG